MPTVARDGVRLATLVIGEGEPVTLVAHGLTGRKEDLALLAPFIPGTKVLFDFRGHGESERPGPGSYTMDHFAGDVDDVAREHGATRAVGVSLGGGATGRLLLREPDRFERLVFILPARLERSDAARDRLLRTASLLESMPLEEAADLLVAEEEAEGMFEDMDGGAERRRQAILGMNADGIPHAIRGCLDDPPLREAGDGDPLHAVKAPVLVIGQEGDPIHSADVARELASALPNAELLVYPDRTAMLRDVIALTQRVASFLGSGPS